jgi:HK97 family phage prohead protease
MILYRSASAPSLRPAPPSRAEGGVEETPTMFGHFATFNQWTEIDSAFEGRFMERVAPGAFARSLAHDRRALRVLFQHGRDPSIGDKVLGIPSLLREDELGAQYEVPLLDTSYVADLIPGLQAGAYGASFRFKVLREDLNDTAGASSYNPKGLPERTIREAKVLEFGPVTFPAYEGATAGVRSLTDWYLEAA